jgi:hypothetical protein
MKRISFCFLMVLMCSLGFTAQTKTPNHKFPAEISKITAADSQELLENPAIKMRLKKLLGTKNYEAFTSSFETVSPVEKKGAFLFSSGCIIHGCSNAESAIAVDLTNNTIHAAIYDRTKPTKFFNENRRKTPKVIRGWANRLASLK